MSAEEENELIALKSRLWKLRLDRNNPESTFNKHKDKIPVGSADVAAFLSKVPWQCPRQSLENSTRLLRATKKLMKGINGM